ncbi:PQQ-dependent sugar dehydrogenase [Peribacillus sp. SCS-155]|uniref:PQQ-dependent sugar dehydrogenase n=1 Tax=Peribacillus sedimenti TaxID=3115297 RepID=UPI0039066591
MKRMRLVILLFVVFISGCSGLSERRQQGEVENVETAGQPEKGNSPEIMLTKLKTPWSISKTEDIFFISEREGSIVKWEDAKVKRETVQLKQPLSTRAEAGLLGFVPHPDFSSKQLAYAYYTYEKNGTPLNRVITLHYTDGKWVEQDILLDNIPSGDYHHGGRIKIGPDGKLFVTTGDATKSEIAQDKKSLGGKILRMNLDGSIPEDNPIPDSYVYSFGHRNPQGLAWSEEGQLYSGEHGPSAHDEINKITAGRNYGWPIIVGSEKNPGMESPIFNSGTNTWAPSGIAYHQNIIYAAALRGEAVKAFNLKTDEISDMVSGRGRIRDVFIDGDALYFISNNTDGRGTPDQQDDRLYRIQL